VLALDNIDLSVGPGEFVASSTERLRKRPVRILAGWTITPAQIKVDAGWAVENAMVFQDSGPVSLDDVGNTSASPGRPRRCVEKCRPVEAAQALGSPNPRHYPHQLSAECASGAHFGARLRDQTRHAVDDEPFARSMRRTASFSNRAGAHLEETRTRRRLLAHSIEEALLLATVCADDRTAWTHQTDHRVPSGSPKSHHPCADRLRQAQALTSGGSSKKKVTRARRR